MNKDWGWPDGPEPSVEVRITKLRAKVAVLTECLSLLKDKLARLEHEATVFPFATTPRSSTPAPDTQLVDHAFWNLLES